MILAMGQVAGAVSAAPAAGTRDRGVLALYPWPERTDVSVAPRGVRESLTSPLQTPQRRRLLTAVQASSRRESVFYLLEVEVGSHNAQSPLFMEPGTMGDAPGKQTKHPTPLE